MTKYLVRSINSADGVLGFVEANSVYALFWAVDSICDPYSTEYVAIPKPEPTFAISVISNESKDWRWFTRDDALNPELKARRDAAKQGG